MIGPTADLRRVVTGGSWSTPWKPERYHFLRRSLVETIEGEQVTVPPGYVDAVTKTTTEARQGVKLERAGYLEFRWNHRL
jgi:hypothetical protein